MVRELLVITLCLKRICFGNVLAFTLISEQHRGCAVSLNTEERGDSCVLCFVTAFSPQPILRNLEDRLIKAVLGWYCSSLVLGALYFQPIDSDHKDQFINSLVH